MPYCREPVGGFEESLVKVMRADAGEHLRALQRFDLQGEHVDTAALLCRVPVTIHVAFVAITRCVRS